MRNYLKLSSLAFNDRSGLPLLQLKFNTVLVVGDYAFPIAFNFPNRLFAKIKFKSTVSYIHLAINDRTGLLPLELKVKTVLVVGDYALLTAFYCPATNYILFGALTYIQCYALS